jgi:hypothetical protein
MENQTPTPAHHARLDTFLTILERFSVIALQFAPAIAAPFVSPQAAQIIQAEAPVAQALATAIASTFNPPA